MIHESIFPSLERLRLQGLNRKRSCCNGCTHMAIDQRDEPVCANVDRAWPSEGHFVGCCSDFKRLLYKGRDF